MVAPPAHADSDALAVLETLPVKGRAPKTGYQRSLFGERWTDDVTVADGHNGCDTRNDILRRDLVDVVIRPGSNGCTVLSGILNDPYTGTTVEFLRGPGTSDQIQIDHVVALSDAWQTGAQEWDEVKRRNRQRPTQPAGDDRLGQPTEGRRRRGNVVAAQQVLPL